MKKAILIIVSILVIVVVSFFVYINYFYNKTAVQNITAEFASFSLPENWGKVAKDKSDQNCGYTFWESEKNGGGENAGVSFKFIINNNDCGGDCSVNRENIIIYDFEEIRMSDMEYLTKDDDDNFEEFDLKGKKGFKASYIIKDEDLFAEEGNKDERSAYKKGEIISLEAGGKCIMMYFETFEKHWKTNQKDWQFIQKSIKL